MILIFMRIALALVTLPLAIGTFLLSNSAFTALFTATVVPWPSALVTGIVSAGIGLGLVMLNFIN